MQFVFLSEKSVQSKSSFFSWTLSLKTMSAHYTPAVKAKIDAAFSAAAAEGGTIAPDTVRSSHAPSRTRAAQHAPFVTFSFLKLYCRNNVVEKMREIMMRESVRSRDIQQRKKVR